MTRRWIRLGLAPALAALAPSCVLPADTAERRAQADRFSAVLAPSPPAAYLGLVERVGAIHVHTELSHDSEGTLDELAAGARAAGLDFVFTTEHPSPRQTEGFRGRKNGVDFFPGLEMKARGGSLLVLDDVLVTEARNTPLADVVRDVRSRGGLVVAGHVEEHDPKLDLSPVDAIGVFNLHAAVKETGPVALAPPLIFTHLFYRGGLEWLPLVRVRTANLAAWDLYRLPGVAEADAHQNVSVLGMRLDPYEKSLGFCRNHFFASASEESAVALKEAIRAGRGFIAFDFLADSTGSRFWTEGPRGLSSALGAAVPFSPGMRIRAELPASATIRLVRDGEAYRVAEGRSLDFPLETSGDYRFEVFLPVLGRATPWILTNPIRVAPPVPLVKSAPPETR